VLWALEDDTAEAHQLKEEIEVFYFAVIFLGTCRHQFPDEQRAAPTKQNRLWAGTETVFLSFKS
jgi:hypothetical protein